LVVMCKRSSFRDKWSDLTLGGDRLTHIDMHALFRILLSKKGAVKYNNGNRVQEFFTGDESHNQR